MARTFLSLTKAEETMDGVRGTGHRINYNNEVSDSEHRSDSADSMETQAGGRRDDPEVRAGDTARARGGRDRFERQQRRRSSDQPAQQPPFPLTPIVRGVTVPFVGTVGRTEERELALRRQSGDVTSQVNLRRRGLRLGLRLEGTGPNPNGENRTAVVRAGDGRVTADINDYSPRTGRHRRRATRELQTGPDGPSATVLQQHHRRRSSTTSLMSAEYDRNARRATIDYGQSHTWNEADGPHTQSFGMGIDVARDGVEVSGSMGYHAPDSAYAVRASASTNLATTVANVQFGSTGQHGTDYLNAEFDGTLQFHNPGFNAEGVVTGGVGGNWQNMNLQSSLTAQGALEGTQGQVETAAVGAMHTGRATFQQLPAGIPGTGYVEHTVAIQGNYDGDDWHPQAPVHSWEAGYDPAPRPGNGPANAPRIHGQVVEEESSSDEEGNNHRRT